MYKVICWYNDLSHLNLIINFSGDNCWKNVSYNTIKIILVIMKIRLSFTLKINRNYDVLNANFVERWYYGSLKKRGVVQA